MQKVADYIPFRPLDIKDIARRYLGTIIVRQRLGE
jgi:hypothetical protein